MKRTLTTRTFAIALLTFFTVTTTIVGNAQCSAGGVAGKYGFTTTGTIVRLGPASANVFSSGVLVRTTHFNLAYVDHQSGLLAIFLTSGTVVTIDARKSF